MNFENKIFEQKGLKVDKDRVLTYSQLSCPLDCKYCFVEDLNFNQKKNVTYLSKEQYELIKNLPEEIKLIMLGCDTEFFQNKKDSLKILEDLAELNKDISVITKLALSPEFLKSIKKIDEQLRKHKNFLAFSISLPCVDSAKEWEAGVPSPEKRIDALKNAHQAGLKTLVALRPLLPTVSNEELEQIVRQTKDFCSGYYSGPLYLKDLKLIEGINIENLKIEKLQPHWMPEGNIFYKVEKEGQMKSLKSILRKYDKPLFEGAAEGIKYLKQHEEH